MTPQAKALVAAIAAADSEAMARVELALFETMGSMRAAARLLGLKYATLNANLRRTPEGKALREHCGMGRAGAAERARAAHKRQSPADP